MKTIFHLFLAAVLVTAFHSGAFASDTGTMSCKGGIVSIGDTPGEVVSKCGQPASASQREKKIVADGTKTDTSRTVTTVAIDDWIYNFGPNQFQYQLLFENGRVSNIMSLDYGY